MELRDVLRTTPAVRDFTEEPVDDATLHAILDTARFAPSGGNRQGWRLIVLQDRELRRRIRDHYVLGWREYTAYARQGLVPFAPGTPPVDLEEARRTPAPLPFADHLDEVPVLLVLLAELAALAVTDRDLPRQSIVGGASVYPFAHNVLLAARDAGLGGVLTTVLVRDEPEVQALLGIPDGFVVAGLIALGHPRKQVTKLRRSEVQDFTTVDRFDGRPFP